VWLLSYDESRSAFRIAEMKCEWCGFGGFCMSMVSQTLQELKFIKVADIPKQNVQTAHINEINVLLPIGNSN
jgi:hypothetical protein